MVSVVVKYSCGFIPISFEVRGMEAGVLAYKFCLSTVVAQEAEWRKIGTSCKNFIFSIDTK